MSKNKKIRTVPLAIGTVFLFALAGRVGATDETAGSMAGIQVSFKLDPRLSGPTYGGEHWVSPSTFHGASAQDTIEARAGGIDGSGRSVAVSPSWVPSDPEMVTVSPAQGDFVKITVKRTGECKLKVTAEGVSRELAIKAVSLHGFLQVEIVQVDAGKPAAAPLGAAAKEPPRTTELQTEATAKERPAKAANAQTARQIADQNKQQGEVFLAANKKNEGVVTLASGLQYKILREGTGQKPGPGDVVLCQYRGTLIDGTEFASSYKKRRPARMPVAGVNKGWNEALQLMAAGSRWQIFVPAALAYGERGFPRVRVGPNMALIFDVELLAIKPKAGGASKPADPVTAALAGPEAPQ